ncbi:hypothetical protein BSKO_07622 [Bryopsis sp. KO-2023]|nr:hypothetical protein BSKO_07622 [Bryopsis sp. KO-2023]
MNGILVIKRESGECIYHKELVPKFGLGKTASELTDKSQAPASSSSSERVQKLAATIVALQLQANEAVHSSKEKVINNAAALRRFVSKDVHILFEVDDSYSLLGVLVSPVDFVHQEERASRAVKASEETHIKNLELESSMCRSVERN